MQSWIFKLRDGCSDGASCKDLGKAVSIQADVCSQLLTVERHSGLTTHSLIRSEKERRGWVGGRAAQSLHTQPLWFTCFAWTTPFRPRNSREVQSPHRNQRTSSYQCLQKGSDTDRGQVIITFPFPFCT